VLHEALTARPDPLHLALVSGLSRTTASTYTIIACDLLDRQPAEGAEAQHYAPGAPGGIPESSGVEGQRPGSCCVLAEDTEDMNRERAEAFLRQLAEAELRRARTLPAARIGRPQDSAGLALVAPALVAVGAVDAGTAAQIRADLELAVAGRQPGEENSARLMRSFSGRVGTTVAHDQALSTGHARPAPHRASWRVVPVGQVIHWRDGDVRHELLVVAYLRSAGGARFIMAGWPFRPLTAADDRGASYHVGYQGGPGVAEFLLSPDPPGQIRWLDLITAPGEPATRIDLDPPIPASDVTMTRNAHSPGELLLDVIAARILCSGPSVPQDDPERPPAATADLRAFIADGPGEIVVALHASGALPPASPVPGQLAGLCTRIGIPGHGITAPPADLPEPWHSMLTRPRRLPEAEPAPGILAATVAELPELDGAHITILGLHHCTIVGRHNSATQTIVHTLVSGVTAEDDWTYGRVVRPLPALWVRDSSGRWHATRTYFTMPSGTSGEVVLWLEIVPPLDRDTAWIDLVATGRSAEVRVRLPLSWT
jgi:hypothetical protein